MKSIQNARFRVSVADIQKGFLISSIQDLRYAKEWIDSQEEIRNERSSQISFDQQYAGGMEFIFPGDEQEMYKGKLYEDHGLLWRMHYEIQTTSDSMTADSMDSKYGLHVWFQIKLLEDQIKIYIRINNTSTCDLPYLARLHPAFAIGRNAMLELNIREVIFEEQAAYCSFRPQKNMDKQKENVIHTEDKEVLVLERPDTWKKHDIFCHIRQSAGEFTIQDDDRKLRITYDSEKMPYLTLCSFQKNGRRICIAEPATIPGVSLQSAAGRIRIPKLLQGEAITYEFEIIPE